MQDTDKKQPIFSNWRKEQSLRIKSVIKEIQENTTVAPRNIWDFLGYSGTILVFLVLIQLFTGLLLLVHYYPHPVKAFTSLIAIKNDIPNGLLFSNIHTINAKLIVLIVFVHMFRIMLISGFRGPRAPQWYTGIGLLTVMLVTGFSGYLLPWSQQSYWACVIGTEAVRSVPIVGDFILEIIRGSQDVSGATLTRFYLLHILFLPITIILLLWYHIKQVWRAGVIAPPEMHAFSHTASCVGCGTCKKHCSFDAIRMVKKRDNKIPAFNDLKCNGCRECMKKCPEQCIDLKSDIESLKIEPIFPHNILHRITAVITVITLLFVGVYFFHGLLIATKIPADPLVTPDKIKPDWYFLGPYQVLKVLPTEFAGLAVLSAIFLVLIFMPAINRSGPRTPEKRTKYIFLVKTGIFSFIIFTIWGWLS